jgi:ABC-type Fe3+-siderophore transport system permease subunit
VTGVILLFFLALLVAFFWNKLRKRTGLGISSKTWMGAIIVFVVVVALLYANSQGH